MTAVAEGFPDAAAQAALRAWYEGMSARAAVERYLGSALSEGGSARGVIGRLRRQLAALAASRHRPDLVAVFDHPAGERTARAREVGQALDALRNLPPALPLLGDEVARWLPARTAAALTAAGIDTLAALAVRARRRRGWWRDVPGIGAIAAQAAEALLASVPQFGMRAARVAAVEPGDHGLAVVPWERFNPTQELDGSQGRFRAPSATCALAARNDGDAVQAWLSLHEAPATQRTYRKEAERLLLWAIVERGRPLSSLSTEDAVAYRAFLRRPWPPGRWIGPPRPRAAVDWRPFAGSLSARSAAHALAVLGAMFRWLVEQRYLYANPFSGIKVRGGVRAAPLDASRVFTDAEWALVRTIADGLEGSYGWSTPAARRLRFVLDFAYATGLRAGELVGARLGGVETDAGGADWLHLIGKGAREGKVALPPLARAALDGYLAQRGLPAAPHAAPELPLIASLDGEADIDAGITSTRLRSVLRRFFMQAAGVVEAQSPAMAGKLRRATPHWMRHTHATHALARGAGLTTVRDNLRHASISTTSVYLHADDAERSRQLGTAFAAPAG